MIRIATYNINSVRLRIERVLTLLKELDLDILCLQETKVDNPFFPLEAFHNAGYIYTAYHGEKSYNGMALISRIPLKDVSFEYFYNEHRRHLAATLSGDIRLHNFYIPAGGDIPDAETNPKFKHKLAYVDAMSHHFRDKTSRTVILGDFNIAPMEHDVWSHKQLLKIVSHTPIEVEKLGILQKTQNWVDAPRLFVPEGEKLYSWWSYRNQDWRKSDRGRRLDHIWVTPDLKPNVANTLILKDHRDGDLASDHVPVVMELNI